MKKKIEISLEIPSLPNYIRTKDGHTVIHISTLTQNEIKHIGAEWTKALLKKSKRNP